MDRNNFFENLARLKLRKEEARMIVTIEKQRLVYSCLPHSFNSLDISSSFSFDKVQDKYTRQRLTERYDKALQQTKSDMMLVSVAVAEAKMDETQKKFDDERSTIKNDQQSGSVYKKLTSTIMYILEQRFHNIERHLIHLYQLKLPFFWSMLRR